MKVTVFTICILFSARLFAGQAPPGFQDEVLISGLKQPTSCEFAPDGRLFILEKQGNVRIYSQGKLLAAPALQIQVNTISERGLLGITFDPEFKTNRFLYIYYTTASSAPKNRVSRFIINGNIIDRASETILVDGIRSDAGNHNAGCLRFGPDGKLYISTGDGGQDQGQSQDLNSINGKILRINKDGTIPSDNPFAGQAGRRGEIYCYGLRNPWRFAFDSANGSLFIADVGGSNVEELNLGIRGMNYGWPIAEGPTSNPNTVNPIFSYNHDGKDAAIVGGAIYRGRTFPQQYQGAYFFADYARQFIRYLKLTPSNTVSSINDFSPDAGSVTHITTGPDGAIYYAFFHKGQIHRVQFTGGNNSIPVAKARANRRYGLIPLSVHFSANGSFDPDGNPIQFQWQFGDGSSGNGSEVTHVFNRAVNTTVRLTVTDSKGASAAAPSIRIFPGDQAPIPAITKPDAGMKVRPGQTIRFSGSASDPDEGKLDKINLTWTVVLHHDRHTHPFFGPVTGITTGTITIPLNDHTTGEVFYRVMLTAKDARGLTITKFVDLRRE